MLEFLGGLDLADWVFAATGVLTAATAITALTPSRVDDKWLGYALAVLNFLAGNVLKNRNADAKPPRQGGIQGLGVILVAGLLLGGCAGLGDLRPQNPREALVEAEMATIAIAEQLTSARAQGLIKRGSATDQRVKTLLGGLALTLDLAHAALAGPEPETFLDILIAVNAALMELRQILTERNRDDITDNRSQPLAAGIALAWRHDLARDPANPPRGA